MTRLVAHNIIFAVLEARTGLLPESTFLSTFVMQLGSLDLDCLSPMNTHVEE